MLTFVDIVDINAFWKTTFQIVQKNFQGLVKIIDTFIHNK